MSWEDRLCWVRPASHPHISQERKGCLLLYWLLLEAALPPTKNFFRNIYWPVPYGRRCLGSMCTSEWSRQSCLPPWHSISTADVIRKLVYYKVRNTIKKLKTNQGKRGQVYWGGSKWASWVQESLDMEVRLEWIWRRRRSEASTCMEKSIPDGEQPVQSH